MVVVLDFMSMFSYSLFMLADFSLHVKLLSHDNVVAFRLSKQPGFFTTSGFFHLLIFKKVAQTGKKPNSVTSFTVSKQKLSGFTEGASTSQH